MNNESLIYMGDSTDVELLSGKKVKIRETNGDDDAILSKIKDASDGSNINNFLANIIEMDYDLARKPLSTDILDWLVNDKYYLLFKQRMINQGKDFLFTNECKQCKAKNEFTEDLGVLDELANRDYKYKLGKEKIAEFTISSGQKLRIHLLDGYLEKEGLDKVEGETNQNTSLTNRHIEIFEAGSWVRLFSFGRFKSKVMGEIRGFVKRHDTQFEPIVHFPCPKCETAYSVPLMYIPVFFYPEGETQM